MANATTTLLNAGFTMSTTDRFLTANIAGACVLYTGTVATAFDPQELTDVELLSRRGWPRDATGLGQFYPAADPLAAIFGVT